MASVVLPVPTSPVKRSPSPASSWSEMSSAKRRTGRTMTGSMSTTGGALERHVAVALRDHRGQGARPGAADALGAAAAVARGLRLRVDHEAAAVAHLVGAGPAHCEAVLGHVGHEARVLGLEGELDVAQGAVAVLGDEELRLARVLGLLLRVVLVAEDEHDEVGVLLEAAGLAQVGEQRLLVAAALLDAAVELRQRDHRHVELAREDLQPAAHLADLLDPALDAVVGAHELEVVDDDQPELVAAGAGGAPWPGSRACRRRTGVVDVQRRLGEVVGGLR